MLGTFIGTVITSILVMLLAPIVVRLVYEGFMMSILLVKNVTEINNKPSKD